MKFFKLIIFIFNVQLYFSTILKRDQLDLKIDLVFIIDLIHGINSNQLDIAKSDLVSFLNQLDFEDNKVNIAIIILADDLKFRHNIDGKKLDKESLIEEINNLEPKFDKRDSKLIEMAFYISKIIFQLIDRQDTFKAVVLISKGDFNIKELKIYAYCFSKIKIGKFLHFNES